MLRLIPSQNFDVYYGKEVPDISMPALQSKLLDERRGGGCYESSSLLLAALLQLGFDIRMVPAFPLNSRTYNPSIPSSHDILIANISSNLFLVDVGYGNNSVRYPVQFSFDETQEINAFPGESYQMLLEKDYYQLNLLIEGKLSSLYRFNKPMEFIGAELISKVDSVN